MHCDIVERSRSFNVISNCKVQCCLIPSLKIWSVNVGLQENFLFSAKSKLRRVLSLEH